jgi:hypothetical protein
VARKTANKKLRVEQMKPAKFKDYLTLGELALAVGRDKSRIRKLERAGKLPEGIRHKIGRMEVRLYPPARVEEIKQIFSQMRPGRPRRI